MKSLHDRRREHLSRVLRNAPGIMGMASFRFYVFEERRSLSTLVLMFRSSEYVTFETLSWLNNFFKPEWLRVQTDCAMAFVSPNNVMLKVLLSDPAWPWER